jgi:hypothetical protein
MNVEELAWGIRRGCFSADPETVLLDVGWLVVSSVDAGRTRSLAEANRTALVNSDTPGLREIRISAMDGKTYRVQANFSSGTVEADTRGMELLADCSAAASGGVVRLDPGQAVLFRE